jgi:hypothetical protein
MKFLASSKPWCSVGLAIIDEVTEKGEQYIIGRVYPLWGEQIIDLTGSLPKHLNGSAYFIAETLEAAISYLLPIQQMYCKEAEAAIRGEEKNLHTLQTLFAREHAFNSYQAKRKAVKSDES